MNIRKVKSLITDQSHKSEYEYFTSLKNEAKHIADCAECYGRDLLLIPTNGDTYQFSWNGCKQRFNCEYSHKNQIKNYEFSKYELIELLQEKLYDQVEWKLF